MSLLKLKEARDKAGYTVDEVAAQLNIRKQYIICLEEGNTDAIPGKVYVEGYKKMYCEFLGIDVPNNKTLYTNMGANKHPHSTNGVKKQYIVLLSTLILILVISIYTILQLETIDETKIGKNISINSTQEGDGNNTKELDRSDS